MTNKVYQVMARWGARKETPENCAARLVQTLNGLAAIHPAFAGWYRKGKKPSASLKPFCTMPARLEELTGIVERGARHTDDHVLWPERGFGVSAWNGHRDSHAVSLEVSAGSYTKYLAVPNEVELRPRLADAANSDMLNASVLPAMIRCLAAAWDPDWASVASDDYTNRLYDPTGTRLPRIRSGWITYLSPAYLARITLPQRVAIQRLPGGGIVMIAADNLFTIDDPTHLQAADAIQAALLPLQSP